MTEHEWLTSEEPVAMLEYLTNGRLPQVISERKAEMCWKAIATKGGFQIDGEIESPNHWMILDSWLASQGRYYTIPKSDKANLLREIVGNPFLKVRISKDFLLCDQCRGEGKIYHASYPYPAFEDYDMSPIEPIPIELVTCGQCNGKRYLWKPSWLTPKVRDMAQHIYDSNEWDLMPQLGDLLEESGCDNEEILRHCQQEKRCVSGCQRTSPSGKYCHYEDAGPYESKWHKCKDCNATGWIPKRIPCVRGCWVVDLLLGNN